ncbi:MAG: hypothetical protein AB1589_03020 [Cyanobacteriota bacterium]
MKWIVVESTPSGATSIDMKYLTALAPLLLAGTTIAQPPPPFVPSVPVTCIVTTSQGKQPLYSYRITGEMNPKNFSLSPTQTSPPWTVTMTNASKGSMPDVFHFGSESAPRQAFDFKPKKVFRLNPTTQGLWVGLGLNNSGQLIAQVQHSLSPTYTAKSNVALCFLQ